MKKQILLTILWAIFSLCINAQPTTPSSTPSNTDSLGATAPAIREMTDEDIVPPSYPGGESALLRFLAQNIRYPALAREKNIQGVVALTFIVEKEGTVSNVTIIRDIGGGCGQEAARTVAAMPKWVPATVDGEPVRVRFTLPVRFKLEGEEKVKKKKWWQRDTLFGN